MLKLYLHFIKIYIRSKIEYRFGFFFELFANFILIGAYFLGIWIIFRDFNKICGWNYYEFVFLFTFNWLSYSISSFFLWAPMRDLGSQIRTGEFDSFLVRPINPLTYMVCRQFQYTFLPRLILAVIFLLDSISHLKINWNFANILYFIVSQISGFIIYSCMFILTGSISFWIIKSDEFQSIITNNDYGIRTYADYPITIFPKWIQFILTFILPYSLAGFYPVTYLLCKTEEGIMNKVLQFASFGIALIIFALTRYIWNKGLKHYGSVGS